MNSCFLGFWWKLIEFVFWLEPGLTFRCQKSPPTCRVKSNPFSNHFLLSTITLGLKYVIASFSDWILPFCHFYFQGVIWNIERRHFFPKFFETKAQILRPKKPLWDRKTHIIRSKNFHFEVENTKTMNNKKRPTKNPVQHQPPRFVQLKTT
jgi:hypothetical protein